MKLNNLKSNIKGLTSKKGMSLPELITVIVIIAIIGASAIAYVVNAVSEANHSQAKQNSSAVQEFLTQADAMGAVHGLGSGMGQSLSATMLDNWAAGLAIPSSGIILKFVTPPGFHSANYTVDAIVATPGTLKFTVTNPTLIP